MNDEARNIDRRRWATALDRLWLVAATGAAVLSLAVGPPAPRDDHRAGPDALLAELRRPTLVAFAALCGLIYVRNRQLAALQARAAQFARRSPRSPEAVLARHCADLNAARKDLQRRTSELEIANRDLAERGREIESFYHVLSHELRTPLTAIREFLAIVRDGVTGDINAAQRECMDSAIESCDHMRRCVDDLFDVARLETGRLTIRRSRVAPAELLHRATERLKPAAGARGVRLIEEFAEPLPDIDADPDRFVQIATNLLHNAIKFSESDTDIRVRARGRQGPTGLGELLVEVIDDGSGIPADELERIFERLHQVRSDELQTQGGLGLGLALCRELVEQHHGRIEIESRLHHGTTVRFTIPASGAVADRAILTPRVLPRPAEATPT